MVLNLEVLHSDAICTHIIYAFVQVDVCYRFVQQGEPNPFGESIARARASPIGGLGA